MRLEVLCERPALGRSLLCPNGSNNHEAWLRLGPLLSNCVDGFTFNYIMPLLFSPKLVSLHKPSQKADFAFGVNDAGREKEIWYITKPVPLHLGYLSCTSAS